VHAVLEPQVASRIHREPAEQRLAPRRTHQWSHDLGEIVTAVSDAGMQVTGLVEHDSVPWEALSGQMQQVEGGGCRLADRPWRLPHT
jgi:hypothetical protein